VHRLIAGRRESPAEDTDRTLSACVTRILGSNPESAHIAGSWRLKAFMTSTRTLHRSISRCALLAASGVVT
jgi:hypothetical protein